VCQIVQGFRQITVDGGDIFSDAVQDASFLKLINRIRKETTCSQPFGVASNHLKVEYANLFSSSRNKRRDALHTR
jgi:hypothetical protein